MKRIVAGLVLTLVVGAADAGLIVRNGFTHDTETDVVIGGELEWLQWDVTHGKSIDQVSDTASWYYQSGWRVASVNQMNGLFSSFGLNGHIFSATENLSSETYLPNVVSGENADATAFFAFFGVTTNTDATIDEYRDVAAWYGNDVDQDGKYNLAKVTSDYERGRDWHVSGTASLKTDHYASDFSALGVGVALVRSVPSVSVPEPSTLALLGLGLAGLTFRRWPRA